MEESREGWNVWDRAPHPGPSQRKSCVTRAPREKWGAEKLSNGAKLSDEQVVLVWDAWLCDL